MSFYCLWWDVSNIERIKLNLDLIRNQYWRLRIKKISGSLSRRRFAALRRDGEIFYLHTNENML